MVALPELVPGHLGTLHAYEQVLVLLIAFGPFVVIGALVVVLRRRDLAAEEARDQARDQASDQGDEPGQAGPSASQDAPT